MKHLMIILLLLGAVAHADFGDDVIHFLDEAAEGEAESGP